MSFCYSGKDSGLTTIEEARNHFERMYDRSTILGKVELKCWLNHSESRNRNGNPPFSFRNYSDHMRPVHLVEQINLNMIDVSDIGTKESVIQQLKDFCDF